MEPGKCLSEGVSEMFSGVFHLGPFDPATEAPYLGGCCQKLELLLDPFGPIGVAGHDFFFLSVCLLLSTTSLLKTMRSSSFQRLVRHKRGPPYVHCPSELKKKNNSVLRPAVSIPESTTIKLPPRLALGFRDHPSTVRRKSHR